MTVQAAGLAGSKAVSSLGLGLGKPFQICVYISFTTKNNSRLRTHLSRAEYPWHWPDQCSDVLHISCTTPSCMLGEAVLTSALCHQNNILWPRLDLNIIIIISLSSESCVASVHVYNTTRILLMARKIPFGHELSFSLLCQRNIGTLFADHFELNRGILVICLSVNQAYRQSSLLTMEHINHWAYQPLSLSTIELIDHWAYWPSGLSTIVAIDQHP